VKLRYTARALRELNSALKYIGEASPQGADKVRTRMKAVSELLTRHPFIGANTDKPGVRRIHASPYPYAVLYRVRGEEVIIVSVRHGARSG
jgi:addiction module RelE/StbE family toxin